MDHPSGNWKLLPNPTTITGDVGAPGGTLIWEVDAKGHQVGPDYYSFRWTNRIPPESRKAEASPQWIEEIVISESPDGAQAGVAGKNLDINLPLHKINEQVASSSPFNRDVLVKLVDQGGSELTRFTMAYLTVVGSEPVEGDSSELIATKILISNSNIFERPDFTLGRDGKPVRSNPSARPAK